jgi:hypothetical protein
MTATAADWIGGTSVLPSYELTVSDFTVTSKFSDSHGLLSTLIPLPSHLSTLALRGLHSVRRTRTPCGEPLSYTVEVDVLLVDC